MFVHDEIREHFLQTVGVEEWTPAKILKWNWCSRFEHLSTHAFSDSSVSVFLSLCKNRMVNGFFRYGSMWDRDPNSMPGRDALLVSINKRLKEYAAPFHKGNKSHSNQEHLVDVWNLLMCLFVMSHTRGKPDQTKKYGTLDSSHYTLKDVGYMLSWFPCQPDSRGLICASQYCLREFLHPKQGAHFTPLHQHNFHVVSTQGE